MVQVKLVLHRVVAAGEAPEHARADFVAAVTQRIAGLQRARFQQPFERAARLALVALGHVRAGGGTGPARRFIDLREPPDRADRIPEQRAIVARRRVLVVAPAHAARLPEPRASGARASAIMSP